MANELSFLFWNIKKPLTSSEILGIVTEQNPDIIGFAEPSQKSEVLNKDICDTGYLLIKSDSQKSCSVYVKANLHTTQIDLDLLPTNEKRYLLLVFKLVQQK